jgi:hypothetical protein
MNIYELKEIRTYTANELFKTKSKTDQLYSEFMKVKQMRDETRELCMKGDMIESQRPSFDSIVNKLDV